MGAENANLGPRIAGGGRNHWDRRHGVGLRFVLFQVPIATRVGIDTWCAMCVVLMECAVFVL